MWIKSWAAIGTFYAFMLSVSEEASCAPLSPDTAMKGVNRQLQAHCGISMNKGITPETVLRRRW